MLKNLFPSSLMTRPNKLEGLSLETLSSQVLIWGQAQSHPKLEHLSYASFLGKLLVLPANVRLDWKKSLPGTNTLAYLASLSATKEKSFTTLTPGANVVKIFTDVSYYFS
jgi:hypothetical protein